MSAEPDHPGAPRTLLALYNEALPVVYGYFVPQRQPYGLMAECADDQGARFYLGQF